MPPPTLLPTPPGSAAEGIGHIIDKKCTARHPKRTAIRSSCNAGQPAVRAVLVQYAPSA